MELIKANQTISSREIAELSGKMHKHVLDAIRVMEPAWENVTGTKFRLSEYTDSTGRKLPQYELNKKECLYVATKFNDEARAKLVLRWEELETSARSYTIEEMMIHTLQQSIETRKRVEAIEARMDAHDKERELAESNLFALPAATEEVAPITRRAELNQAVRLYAVKMNIPYNAVWKKLYAVHYARYHVNISLRAKNARCSGLDYAEKHGHIEQLIAIINHLSKIAA